MQSLLRASGAPPLAIAEVPAMVQSCDVCRRWHPPPDPNNVTTGRLVTEFNDEVQFDLWFYRSLIDEPENMRTIGHVIDVCLRLCAQEVMQSKAETELCNFISRCWVAVHTPMKLLVQDGETGMRTRSVADWASTCHIDLKFKPPTRRHGLQNVTKASTGTRVTTSRHK